MWKARQKRRRKLPFLRDTAWPTLPLRLAPKRESSWPACMLERGDCCGCYRWLRPSYCVEQHEASFEGLK